jgi:hypothetical protein
VKEKREVRTYAAIARPEVRRKGRFDPLYSVGRVGEKDSERGNENAHSFRRLGREEVEKAL